MATVYCLISNLRSETVRFSIVLAAIVLAGAYIWWDGRPVDQPPGILVAEPPAQTNLGEEEVIRHGDLTIVKVARFDVTARVLSKERYWFGREARLAPYDLALGWGRMSDTKVLDKISISQRGRYYYWSVRDYPIPRGEITSNSANMHLIPASEEVREALDRVRRGRIVRFNGYLVRVTGPKGWRWNTSTTRTDTGPGACELVWVESFNEGSD